MAIVKKSIYAEDLLCAIRDDPSIKGKDFAKIKRHIADAQELDMIPVVHGRNLDADTQSLFECSVCHWCCTDTYFGDTADYNYCPNCGAKMEGGKDNGYSKQSHI